MDQANLWRGTTIRRYGVLRALRNLVFTIALAASGAAAAAPVTVVALGDSLTHGYGLPEEQGLSLIHI